jgi:hypothetical protein
MAAQQLVSANRGFSPFVIATGGVGIQSWLATNQPLRDLIATAAAVEIWGENEMCDERRPDAVKQARTDVMRARLQAAVAEVRHGGTPDIVYPPSGLKDAAEWNAEPSVPGICHAVAGMM